MRSTYIVSILALTLAACGTEPAVKAAPVVVAQTQPLPAGVVPGIYHLALAADANNTFGCRPGSEALVNVAITNSVADVTYAASPQVHLDTTAQETAVTYTAGGASTSEWCQTYYADVSLAWETTFDTHQLGGSATLVTTHACTGAVLQCAYTVTATRD